MPHGPQTARIVLRAEERETLVRWARRLAGLRDDPRVGAPRRISDADVERTIATTLE